MSGHTYTHTHIHTHTHTYTHTYIHTRHADNYYNPRCAHAHRGLIRRITVYSYIYVLRECLSERLRERLSERL